MFKIFKKTSADQKRTATRRILSTTELTQVSGGLNPQPLPPSHDPHEGRRV